MAFEKFSKHYPHAFCEYPPTCKTDANIHGLVLEVKLNSGSLIEWTKQKHSGNRHIFLNPGSHLFCKAVVINSGEESMEFIANMHLESPKEKYAECIKTLKASHINVFYKPTAYDKSFHHLIDRIVALRIENQEMKSLLQGKSKQNY